MCGIVGIVSKNPFSSSEVLKALKRTEYRGYDSFGIVTDSSSIHKQVGEIVIGAGKNSCTLAIAHTRWATHGSVTRENAHPHSDCSGNLFIVHNGIIENYAEMKKLLEEKGHAFRSTTDSEVIAHYLEEKLKALGMAEAIMEFMAEAEGTFAVAVMRKGDKKLYAFKRDSPLCIVPLAGGFALASDVYAFSDAANKAVYLDDNEFAIIDAERYEVFDASGNKIEKQLCAFEWRAASGKGEYEHHMLKEIMEQPLAVRRLLDSLASTQKSKMQELAAAVSSAEKVVFAACGTSYFASLLGAYFLHKAGIEAHALIASEFENYASLDENTLVIAVSQSGETMDVIQAVKYAKSKGAKVAALVNVPFSAVQRLSDLSLSVEAGQEICVASTKTFTNQAVALLSLAEALGYDGDGINAAVAIESVLAKEGEIRQLAKSLAPCSDIYIIGRGLGYPAAREVALKLKEIAYVHAEGMMAGELKHGTLALVEPGVPVIALVDSDDVMSNAKEAEARGARVIAFASGSVPFAESLQLPHGDLFAICAAVAGQLLAYHVAKERGLPIDKPRNLAKSVTVK